MKKLKNFFFALTLCVPLTAAAQDVEINEENFPDKKFRSYLLTQYYGKDGVLTEEEIEKITSLNLFDKGISSLKGIEYFTALTTLECQSNLLTSLDVSNNTALTDLQCGANQLTDLNVSDNIALTILVCSYNQLPSLDISNNTALTKLDCSNNQLTSLDVSNNTALTIWNCSNNQLPSLDASNHTALTWLSCGNNQLASLDMSDNRALLHLYCSKNQLTNLDISGCTTLRTLDCSFNQLPSLDVSNNTELTSLSCSNNQLTALDVSNNTVLTDLYCNMNQIKDESMDALVNSLPKRPAAYLYVYDMNDNGEGNIYTNSHIKAAKAKGWTSYYTNGWYWYEYINIDGEDTSIALPEIENSSATIYTLHGQKVTAPQKGGIYIVNGKKVVVK